MKNNTRSLFIVVFSSCTVFLTACTTAPRLQQDPLTTLIEKEIDTPPKESILGQAIDQAATTHPTPAPSQPKLRTPPAPR